jgi:hypothetical protein
MMANAESSKNQDRPAFSQLDAEDHAEFAVRGREAHLHAMGERGSIRSLLIAGQEIRDRHPTCLVLLAGGAGHLHPCSTCASHVLAEGSIIE